MTVQTGIAGGSARREHERRAAKDEARIRSDWGRFGGLAVALTPERTSTRVWSTGANGEEIVGARLDSIASDAVRVLHDRRIPGSRANIDHIVVTPAAVWVIDAKKYKGSPGLQVEGGLFRPRIEKLTVSGRNQTRLVDEMLWQMEHVQSVVRDVPVRGILCFVDADWPFFASPFRVNGVEVMWPKRLVGRLTEAGTALVDVTQIAERLATIFRCA